MTEKKINHIAYQLKSNKNESRPGAIVFIGAGCSVSGGIPIANKIVDEVLDKYHYHPSISCLSQKPTYPELMKCLGPRERRNIFKDYVEKAKINVSHIYLAQLMKLGYVDYIVTVNFDNLAQRGLALENIFPTTYDISILNSMDLATT
jgi:NAD-dependent SIR2 family protein deacetylase